MIDYSIIKNEETKTIAVRSVVTSFGLDHVTDKDIVSFYSQFSNHAQVDTGLLPLDGTGLLAYRQAADYAQVAIQHAPGVYRIMWGSHEGDRSAKHYFLAQPYRIVIADLMNGSLLGARMFYSPVPITSPTNELYHVNLPNINCKGYRGNGVGWVCLYHNEDWSNIPLAEKVARIMERCSGAEAYNDANMSETDGPRFYNSNYKNDPSFAHLWNPAKWEEKSSQGFAWTLDSPTPWIPILVKDRDNQDRHYADGIPLTIGMALTGDYQAYYTDSLHTKPINALTRSDKSYSSENVFQIVKLAYAKSAEFSRSLVDTDPYTVTIDVRSEYTKTSKSQPSQDDDDDDNEETFYCNYCNDHYPVDDHEVYYDHKHDSYCESCINEYFYWIESQNSYFHVDDCVYSEYHDQYVPSDLVHLYEQCLACEAIFINFPNKGYVYETMDDNGNEITVCLNCDPQEDNTKTCHRCQEEIYLPIGKFVSYKAYNSPKDPLAINDHEVTDYYLHIDCSSQITVCPCGFVRNSQIFDQDVAHEWQQIQISPIPEFENKDSCCKKCAIYDLDQNQIVWSSQLGEHSDHIKSNEGSVELANMHTWNTTQSMLAFMTQTVNNAAKAGKIDDIF